MENFDVVVIGGGPAGVTAATRASELGARVALTEGKWMGGTCTNDGCVPTRVLAKTARLIREAEHFGTYGLMGEPPVLDFVQLLGYARKIVQTVLSKKQLVEHLDGAGVRIIKNSGSVRFEDDHTLLHADGSRIKGEKIIICAGGHARRIAFPGSDSPGVLTHSDVWSLKSTPHSVVVVGAAATGCQLASVLAAFGAKVWLLETAPRILTVEDVSISDAVTAAFRHSGIEVITGTGGLDHIDPPGADGKLKVWYKHGGETHPIAADAAILAVGWVGNIEDLNLQAASVKTERGYIVVNDQLQTSTPHIFAAGDITGRVMLVQTANIDGRFAAENAVLGTGRMHMHKIVPHGGFTDPEYGGVGLTEEQARAQESDCAVATVKYSELDRAVIDGHAEGSCKLIVSRKSRMIMGAHVVGEQAVEIVQLAAAGMATGMRVEQLADLELAYPTFVEIIGLAARQIVKELGVMPVTPQWQSMGM